MIGQISEHLVVYWILFSTLFATSVTTPGGRTVNLFEAHETKPVVLVFVRTDCPISNQYAPELLRLYAEFSHRVNFYSVYADRAETDAEVRKHAADYRLLFPVLRDPDHSLLARAKVRVTPEAALFSRTGELLYHGRIDNRYVDLGKTRPVATVHDLEDAVVAILAGRSVKASSVPAVGCSVSDLQ